MKKYQHYINVVSANEFNLLMECCKVRYCKGVKFENGVKDICCKGIELENSALVILF